MKKILEWMGFIILLLALLLFWGLLAPIMRGCNFDHPN